MRQLKKLLLISGFTISSLTEINANNVEIEQFKYSASAQYKIEASNDGAILRFTNEISGEGTESETQSVAEQSAKTKADSNATLYRDPNYPSPPWTYAQPTRASSYTLTAL